MIFLLGNHEVMRLLGDLRYVSDGEYAAFQPGAGIAMGYDDTKVVEARNFVRAIAGEAADIATLDDAVASAAALDAMVSSHRSGEWVELS